jgi:RHS repeat-associated protein
MGSMSFEYTFGGEKIKKTSPDGDRQYVGGMEYKDGGLQLIHVPNGRIIEKEGVKKYQYHLADHLGNIVVLFDDVNEDGTISIEEDSTSIDNEIIQRNHYYSFGLRVDAPHFMLSGKPRADYLYNGKENHEELGLNWLSYGFRMYDPAIGRFPSVDPIADQFAFVSGFNYAENEPVGHIDLWGLQATLPDGTSGPFTEEYVQEQEDLENERERIRQHLKDYTVTEEIGDEAAIQNAEMMMAIFSPDNVSIILMLAQANGGSKVPKSGSALAIPQGLSKSRFSEMSKIIREGAGKFGDDIVIQGSRAKGSATATSDIDVAIRVTKKQFDKLIKNRFGAPNPGSAKEKTMLHAIKTGKIQRGELGLSNLGKQVEIRIGMKVDLSVIRKGGSFDTGPFISLLK